MKAVMNTLKREELKKMMDNKEDFLLIDVLPKESFDKKHIPGAINVPIKDEEDFVKKVQTMTGMKTKKIVTYCGGFACDASEKAAEKLAEAGYTNVYRYEGGLEDWFQMKEKKSEMGKSGSCGTC